MKSNDIIKNNWNIFCWETYYKKNSGVEMEKISDRTPMKEKGMKGQGRQLAILALALMIIVVVYAWNASHLNRLLEHLTEEYVVDVTYQLTNDITSKLESDLEGLQLVADSITKIKGGNSDAQTLRSFLQRKCEIMGNDYIALIEQDGTVISSGEELKDPLKLQGVQEAFAGEADVTHLEEEQSLLFSTPIYVDNRADKVLVGVRTQKNVQDLIRPKSFEGRGMSCIIDKEGNIIIAPEILDVFPALQNMIEGKDNKTNDSIEQVKDNLQKQVDGVFYVPASNGKELMISYHAMGMGDWVLLTMIPADLVTAEATGYLQKTTLIVGTVMVLLVMFLMSSIRFYRSYNKRLERIAYVDPLTEGVNNLAFQKKYREQMKDMEPFSHAVVLFNIKGFKLINEGYGTQAGNDTIRYVYQKIEECLKEGEFVGRSESDHFFLCLQESDSQTIRNRIETIQNNINSFAQGMEMPYTVGFFQGVYLVEDPTMEITIIQDRARAACQEQRKKSETGCAFYSVELMRKMQMEQELENLFDESLVNEDFQVYLQPKVCLDTGRLGGAEALVRWVHPVRSIISPGDFIPLLEKNGKICQLDLFVFRKVCQLQERWKKEGRTLFPISVNLSRQHFKNANFLQTFSQEAGQYDIPTSMIEFELTESIFLDESQVPLVKYGIREMHSKGFLCSLDDFGSGFSSLGMLKAFDVDSIKLDRRFFDDMSSEKTQKIIACLIELANRLEVHTVAEGIETPNQLEYLRQAKCDMIQGYIFSRPLPISEFEQWMDQRNRQFH